MCVPYSKRLLVKRNSTFCLNDRTHILGFRIFSHNFDSECDYSISFLLHILNRQTWNKNNYESSSIPGTTRFFDWSYQIMILYHFDYISKTKILITVVCTQSHLFAHLKRNWWFFWLQLSRTWPHMRINKVFELCEFLHYYKSLFYQYLQVCFPAGIIHSTGQGTGSLIVVSVKSTGILHLYAA